MPRDVFEMLNYKRSKKIILWEGAWRSWSLRTHIHENLWTGMGYGIPWIEKERLTTNNYIGIEDCITAGKCDTHILIIYLISSSTISVA